MIKQYSLARDGDLQLSANFKVREFACPGCDAIFIDEKLVAILQQLRTRFNRSIRIGSGYRTAKYNAQIGGHRSSRHLTGQAADIDVGSGSDLVDPLLVAMTVQAIGSRSIGCYMYADGRSWIHVGSALTNNYWRQAAPGQQVYIKTFLPTQRRIPKQAAVYSDYCLRLQQLLQDRKYYLGSLDGKYGPKSEAAVKAFQKVKNLEKDGVCGPITWKAILL